MNEMILQNLISSFLGQQGVDMWNKWNNLSPQQKQEEMNKVRNLTKEQQQQYLTQSGVDINQVKAKLQGGNTNNQPTTTPKNEGQQFNY